MPVQWHLLERLTNIDVQIRGVERNKNNTVEARQVGRVDPVVNVVMKDQLLLDNDSPTVIKKALARNALDDALAYAQG